MPVFRYKAINAQGSIVTGNLTADVIHEVESWMKSEALSPISIEITAGQPSLAGADSRPESTASTFRERFRGVTQDDKILFCRQLATLLTAGVSILESFIILTAQVTNPVLREIILSMTSAIEKGESLSEAVSRYPKVFNQLFYNIIKMGEETGSLSRAFSYLASLYENEKAIRERVKAATRYPKIVLLAISGAVFFIMSFVVPKFTKLFTAAKVDLPLPTRILMTISDFFANNTLLIVLAGLALVTLYRLALGYPEFIMFRDRQLLRVPIFGPLSVKIFMSRFCRVFSVLTSSGIDIIKTLRLASRSLENVILYDMLQKIIAEVEEGISFHEAMAKHPLIPPMVHQMIAVGEQSGKLDEMMERVADYYDLESEYTIKNLSTLIEPLLLLVMGVMVGLLALAIFTPMWNMMNVAKGGM